MKTKPNKPTDWQEEAFNYKRMYFDMKKQAETYGSEKAKYYQQLIRLQEKYENLRGQKWTI